MFLDKEKDLLMESTDEELMNENVDESIIMESLIQEAGVQNFSEEELYALYECGLLSERSIVRLDKNAHRSRAEKKAALQLAKQNNDPLYKKLAWVYRMKKKLVDAITAKYSMKAKAQVRKFKYTAKGRVDNGASNKKAADAIKKALSKNTVTKTKDI